MAVLLVAPVANTLPSGRSTAGPISLHVTSCTPVLPAVDHTPVFGLYISELRKLCTSTVSTPPLFGLLTLLGSAVQLSSEFESALPVPVMVQVNVEAFKSAWELLQQLPSIKVPSGNTVLCASPIWNQAGGPEKLVHVLL